MKKTLLLAAIMTSALLCSCGNKEAAAPGPAPADSGESQEAYAVQEADKDEADKEEAGLANPWIVSDRDGMKKATGFYVDPPEGALNVKYELNESQGLAQMTFSHGEPEVDYTYRLKGAAEFEDISGCFYEWDVDEASEIQGCEARTKRHIGDEETVDVCLWYDSVAGIMYSLSVSAKDLDGFDITAMAYTLYGQIRGDEPSADVFSPSNFLEARLKQDIFESYDDIISKLEKGNAYTKTRIYGYDGELLIIAEGAYDYGDGVMAALEASVYNLSEGQVKNIGNIYSSGTAYPVSIDSEGRIFSGGNHEVNISCVSAEYGSIMQQSIAYESFDEKGNTTYGGFIRKENKLMDDGAAIAEDDPSVLQRYFEEYGKATPLNYTVVE